MRIGSLFSGIGGLDLACVWALDAHTVWQLDLVGAEVRRRHWPDALQIEGDVREVDPSTLPAVDVLCGGFPCQDLSTAGKGAGLDGARSGLYGELLRFASALRPELLVIENVPAVLKYRERLEGEVGALGYGLTWVKARALDVGAPHIRRRVFILARLGAAHGGAIDADRAGVWTPESDARTWATPTNRDHRSAGGLRHTKGGWCLNDDAAQVGEDGVRPWPTATASVGSGSEGYGRVSASTGRPRAEGTTLTDACRPWPTTTTTRDYKSGDLPNRVGTEALSAAAGASAMESWGRRLNPDWIETLQGFPVGWTLPTGPALRADSAPAWPRGRYPASWDRSVYWPGFDWEPLRTLPDGPPVRGRPARIRGLGNLVVPQQGALAIRTALEPRQGSLFR